MKIDGFLFFLTIKTLLLQKNVLYLHKKNKTIINFNRKMEKEKSSKNYTIIGIVIAVVFLIGIGFTMNISYSNKEVKLVNQFNMEMKNREATFDNMFKVIAQTAQVAEKYKESFKDIYVHITSERYDKDDGVLMKWVQESNPNFDSKLYEKLASEIEIKRQEFLMVQRKLMDIENQHNNLLDVVPSAWFLSGKQRLEYKVISSTRSKQVMETGVEDDIDVFK